MVLITFALVRPTTSILGSEKDRTNRVRAQLDKPITRSIRGFQLHGENMSALIVLLRKVDSRTNKIFPCNWRGLLNIPDKSGRKTNLCQPSSQVSSLTIH